MEMILGLINQFFIAFDSLPCDSLQQISLFSIWMSQKVIFPTAKTHFHTNSFRWSSFFPIVYADVRFLFRNLYNIYKENETEVET